jgi:hypothetical protein
MQSRALLSGQKQSLLRRALGARRTAQLSRAFAAWQRMRVLASSQQERALQLQQQVARIGRLWAKTGVSHCWRSWRQRTAFVGGCERAVATMVEAGRRRALVKAWQSWLCCTSAQLASDRARGHELKMQAAFRALWGASQSHAARCSVAAAVRAWRVRTFSKRFLHNWVFCLPVNRTTITRIMLPDKQLRVYYIFPLCASLRKWVAYTSLQRVLQSLEAQLAVEQEQDQLEVEAGGALGGAVGGAMTTPRAIPVASQHSPLRAIPELVSSLASLLQNQKQSGGGGARRGSPGVSPGR